MGILSNGTKVILLYHRLKWRDWVIDLTGVVFVKEINIPGRKQTVLMTESTGKTEEIRKNGASSILLKDKQGRHHRQIRYIGNNKSCTVTLVTG